MKRTGMLTKVLAWLGTVLLAVPVLAPVVFARWAALGKPAFHIDWLMPGELAPVVLAGAIALVFASSRAGMHRPLVAWGIAVALLGLGAMALIATTTGLASGATEPTGWRMWLVLGTYGVYVAAVLELLVAGVLLLRDLYRHGESHSAPPAVPAA